MVGRNLDTRWTLILAAAALAALIMVFVTRHESEAPTSTHAAANAPRTSEVLGSHEFRAVPAPSLEQSLIAADALVKAGKLPTLAESLQAATLLVQAGKLAPPPTLAESLQAAVALVNAGELAPPPPSLAESLQAATALVNAGVIARPDPPLIDILRAASILAVATADAAAPAQSVAPPPSTNTPLPPVATNTPAPPKKAPATATAVRAIAPAKGDSGYFDDAFSAQVFSEVNQRRSAAGLQTLTVEPRLANAAATYAKVLADNNWFSHTGPDGSTLVTRDEAAGFPFTVQIGEVLAWGSDGWTPSEIVQAWIDSPAHKEQILSAVYTRAGVGCYFTNAGTLMVRCAMELAAG